MTLQANRDFKRHQGGPITHRLAIHTIDDMLHVFAIDFTDNGDEVEAKTYYER